MKLLVAIALMFAVYVPAAYLLNALYHPNDGGPPPSAGTRVRLYPPFAQWPDISFAAAVRDRTGALEILHDTKFEVWENDHLLGPGNCSLSDVVSLGRGRYLVERGRVAFSSSDNTNPTTNGRTYWVVNPN
jgi:hypothetical protein